MSSSSSNIAAPLPQLVIEQVAALLGRQPRGLREVAVSGAAGEPRVIRVASLVDDKPFPTLYWLIDPVLSYRIDQVEASGLIKELQARIDADSDIQACMTHDHRKHISTRDDFILPSEREEIERLGYTAVFETKGIGGIGDFTRIRCLHTWYAAHLVTPNSVGRLLDEWWVANNERQD